MVCTTSLSESNQNVPTKDDDLNELIQEARDITGRNWQVVERIHCFKRSKWYKSNEPVYRYDLYVEVGAGCRFR